MSLNNCIMNAECTEKGRVCIFQAGSYKSCENMRRKASVLMYYAMGAYKKNIF